MMTSRRPISENKVYDDSEVKEVEPGVFVRMTDQECMACLGDGCAYCYQTGKYHRKVKPIQGIMGDSGAWEDCVVCRECGSSRVSIDDYEVCEACYERWDEEEDEFFGALFQNPPPPLENPGPDPVVEASRNFVREKVSGRGRFHDVSGWSRRNDTYPTLEEIIAWCDVQDGDVVKVTDSPLYLLFVTCEKCDGSACGECSRVGLRPIYLADRRMALSIMGMTVDDADLEPGVVVEDSMRYYGDGGGEWKPGDIVLLDNGQHVRVLGQCGWCGGSGWENPMEDACVKCFGLGWEYENVEVDEGLGGFEWLDGEPYDPDA